MTQTKTLRMPHVLVLLCAIIALCSIATYIVPAGEFERETKQINQSKRTLIVPGTYHALERSPVNPAGMFLAVQRGMIKAADIIFFVFLIGGALGMIKQTGALDAIFFKVMRLLKNREVLFIPIVSLAFVLGGMSFGMTEETLAFIAIGVGIAVSLGYDPIVGLAVVYGGSQIGFASAPLNPFTVGIAQGISELPLFSGGGLRVIFMILAYLIFVHHTVKYARKVKADPQASYMAGTPGMQQAEKIDDSLQLTRWHVLTLLTMAVTIVVLVYAVISWGWYINEMAALFLAMGVVGALLGRLPVNQMGKSFVAGASEMIVAALVIGFSRSILVVLADGQILDTIIYGLSYPLKQLPGMISAIGMFVVQSMINFFIPSGSGQAAVTMPIMAPLADLLHVTRQTAVLAFQAGDGFSNMIIPTSGVLMGAVALARIPYDKWLRFAVPLVLKCSLLAIAMIVIASLINYGPF